MHRGGRADHRDRQAARRRTPGRREPGHERTGEGAEELGGAGPVEHEHAAASRAPAAGQRDVAAERHGGLCPGPGQRLLHAQAGEPTVGEDVVQLVHHLGLAHDRQRGEVVRADRVQVDPRESPSVERRERGRVREQCPQPVGLVCADPLAVPGEPADVLGEPVTQRRLPVGTQRRECGGGHGAGHGASLWALRRP